MKRLFIALFVSLMLVGCANPNMGDVGPQTKTITVTNHLSCEAKLNEQIIEGTDDPLQPNTEDVILELGKTYNLRIGATILENFIDCNVNFVLIAPNNFVYINGNPDGTPIN